MIHNPKYGLGSETNFAMQYVPELDTKTGMGEYVVVKGRERGVEGRNLRALLWAGVGVAVGCWGFCSFISGMGKYRF